MKVKMTYDEAKAVLEAVERDILNKTQAWQNWNAQVPESVGSEARVRRNRMSELDAHLSLLEDVARRMRNRLFG